MHVPVDWLIGQLAELTTGSTFSNPGAQAHWNGYRDAVTDAVAKAHGCSTQQANDRVMDQLHAAKPEVI